MSKYWTIRNLSNGLSNRVLITRHGELKMRLCSIFQFTWKRLICFDFESDANQMLCINKIHQIQKKTLKNAIDPIALKITISTEDKVFNFFLNKLI